MTVPVAEDFAGIKAATEALHGNDAPVCPACEDGGWEMYGLGRGDPHYRVCKTCHNPEGLPSP